MSKIIPLHNKKRSVQNIDIHYGKIFTERVNKKKDFDYKLREDNEMMKINGFSGTNTQSKTMGTAQANDSVSKNIQNQIAKAQQKLQDLSSNEELSLEDKMKKRQEIQQEISNLNQQLRQHQLEQRKEQQSKASSMDDMIAGTKNPSAGKGSGLSQEGMQAMISADSSMKQAKVQGSMSAQLKGRAGVLESEIRQDAGKGNTEKKEAELADIQEKAQSATAAQMSALSDVNKAVEKAEKAESTKAANETATTDSIEIDENKKSEDKTTQEKINTTTINKQDLADIKNDIGSTATVDNQHIQNGQSAPQISYTPIDIRL